MPKKVVESPTIPVTIRLGPDVVEPETVLSDPERSLKIRERAQALLRADMLQYVQARQQNRPPKDNQ